MITKLLVLKKDHSSCEGITGTDSKLADTSCTLVQKLGWQVTKFLSVLLCEFFSRTRKSASSVDSCAGGNYAITKRRWYFEKKLILKNVY